MMEDLLAGLLRANLALAAAVLVVAALRRPVRRAFGARAAYALWAAPALAAAAVLLPRPTVETALSPIVLEVGQAAARVAPPVSGDPSVLLLGVWLAGMATAVGLLAVRQARFLREVAAGRAGPAVVGALRPRVVTPADFEARFDAEERGVILAHEDAHLRNGDARINALAAAAQCVCWFNPLAHLAAHLLRIDQELACDAAVMGRYPQARRAYAQAMLKTQLVQQPLPLGCHWPAGSEHPLKERIVMLKSPLPAPARRIAGLALVAALSLGGAAAAWAAQSQPTLITQPVWIEKPTAQDVAEVFPKAALPGSVGLSARGVMTCRVGADGRLRDCDVATVDISADKMVVREAGAQDPGFASAMLALSPRFRMAPESRDGVKTAGGQIRIPIRLVQPD